MSYSGVKKFFENMGFTTKANMSHSKAVSFEQEVSKAINMSMYTYNPIKQKRSSGGFKI